ncbi:MAG: ATP-dependent helicase HrpB [Rhodospirillaceae bacterium]
MKTLPIEPVLPAVRAALADAGVAVLQAPPGAGKTTGVPPALLRESWLGQRRLVVLEPRRLAARAAALRMAGNLSEEVGDSVGYRVRFDSRVGRNTRIEVVTDGLFLRRLQDDPGLDGIGAVLFDEFHERRLDGDLLLALCLESRAALRPDLRLLVMSATLDGGPVAKLLGGAPLITSEGRSYPVETRYLPSDPRHRIEDTVAAAIHLALAGEDGDILAFLPGTAEIRRTEARLAASGLDKNVLLAPLYGDLTLDRQEQAIGPSPPGWRKIVLATSIAETSLTIEGVRVVVDGGLMRVPRFDPVSGMSRLMTMRVSRSSADQRRGRAGRTGPGLCLRLWPEAEQRALLPFTPPELLNADLAPLALELADWGIKDAALLSWLEPPPTAALAQARDLLTQLGAIERDGAITAHGREMARLGAHPRLAHLMVRGRALGQGALACTLAALLGERDIVRRGPGYNPREADLRLRVELLLNNDGHGTGQGDKGAIQQVRQVTNQWRRQLEINRHELIDPAGTGAILALAYPDRIAQRRQGGDGKYRLANGCGAVLPAGDALAAQPWLAVAELDGDRREARVFIAAPLTLAEIENGFLELIETHDEVSWDEREMVVLARRRRQLGALVLADEALSEVPAERLGTALLEGIRRHGLALLPITTAIGEWRSRVAFLRRLEGPDSRWPDLSDTALLATLEDWLQPFLEGYTRASQLKRLDLMAILQNRLDWTQRKALDELAPSHLTVPSGSHLALDYGGDIPTLAVRLQEMFGAGETPTVAGGKVPVLLHLLSPARRPVQITRDLTGFWNSSYLAVRADLRGRYPKHPWPDDPLHAIPTNRTKRASEKN